MKGVFNSKKTFWFIAIGLHLIAFVWQNFGHFVFTKDSLEYLHSAKYIFDSSAEFSNGLFGATKRTLGYPFILWLLGSTPLLVLFFQNALSLFNLWLIIKLLEKQKRTIDFQWLILLLILSPAQIIYSNLVMAEIVLQSCVLGIFYFLILHKKIGLIAVLISLSFLIKPITFLWAFCWPVFILIYFRKSINLKTIGIAMLPLIFFSLAGIINFRNTGVFHLSSQAGINKFHYNAYGVLLKKSSTQHADSIMDEYIYRVKNQPDFKSQYMLQNQISDSIIKSNLFLYTQIHLKGCIACMADPGRFDIATFLNLKSKENGFYSQTSKNGFSSIFKSIEQLGLGMILFLGIMILGILWKWLRIGMYLFNTTESIFNKAVVIFILAYFIFLAGPVGSSRFLVPVYPILFYAILVSFYKSKTIKSTQ